MKRRTFGLLTGASLFTPGLVRTANAQSAPDPSLLKTTLTPFGAERAGNAAGTIPAWTGGFAPGAPDWQGPNSLPGFLQTDKPILTIDSGNYSDHLDQLSVGVAALIQKQGYSIQVYPSHRTHALPQYVYDNIAKNVATASLVPEGGRFGYQNAYGGAPFPIPDTSDPLAAGSQILWNHITRWSGYCQKQYEQTWTISGGVPVLASGATVYYKNPYYDPNGSLSTYAGKQTMILNLTSVPSNLNGQVDLEWIFSNTAEHPNQIWELLNGQGRVRKAPELEFDTPSALANDIINFDEYNGYSAPAYQYDWNYIAKKEMYVPYNANRTSLISSNDLIRPKFLNPDLVRWELHRVWVIEATLHPGYRNTMARRRYYVDEDSWIIMLGDQYDASDNLYHAEVNLTEISPGAIGNVIQRQASHNMQTGDWVVNGNMNSNVPFTYGVVPDNIFNPEVMASQAAF